MNRFFLLSMALGLLFQSGYAQDFDKAKLDDYFNALEKNNRFMGSVTASQNGQIIYSKTVGFADIKNNARADENSKYRIGSISKTFTAVLIFKAVEENKIELDQAIDKYFPTIQNAGDITIERLLYHRSGIRNFTDDEKYLVWNTQEKTEEEMTAIIAEGGSVFEPGSQTAYSNSNYVLLSYILEKSFQKPYAQLLKEYITEPAGLQNTRLGSKIIPENNECKSYRFDGEWKLESETDISIPLGAGGVISTPTDLVRFSEALFGGELLSEESLEQMKTTKENFGMGLIQIPFYSQSGLGHGGGIDGFASIFCHFPKTNLSYALTSNGANYNINDISIAVLSAINGMPYEIPDFKTVYVEPTALDQYLGVYSSSQLPLKITITRDHDTLMGQATGQSAFPLEAAGGDKFRFDQAGIVMEFNPAEKTMILIQGGGRFLYKME